MQRREFLTGSISAVAGCALTSSARAASDPPAPQREFRGVWLATVANIDWPSKTGLPVPQQKAELLSLLDRAVALKLNAVIFQVRPACDALYDSKLEPWSDFLTGKMGQAPEPYYDPLTFVVDEAHRRGLELHAWFNPYRAHHFVSKGPISRNHISRTHPELVKSYGKYLWLDPGEEAVRDYSVSVVRDVVQRYDVDGVHIDDYFYPYKEKNGAGQTLQFPDEPSWQRYKEKGGKLDRDDWRRDNVDQFVHQMYDAVKAEKKWVKVGISPFGIWRPGHPTQIRGFDSYQEIYGDSRKWVRNGWLDYATPQLYWRAEPAAQSYPVLLKWWSEQNEKDRHLWPGNIVDPVVSGKWPAEEIARQVRITRDQRGASGNVYFSMRPLVNNSGLTNTLRDLYAEPALIPASTWLDKSAPAKPVVQKRGAEIVWNAGGEEPAAWWVLQHRSGDRWTTEILPAGVTARPYTGPIAAADKVVVSAVDRCGNQSPHTELKTEG